MELKVSLSIGYSTAMHTGIIDIPDDEVEGMGTGERAMYFSRETEAWANEYIETWWEIV